MYPPLPKPDLFSNLCSQFLGSYFFAHIEMMEILDEIPKAALHPELAFRASLSSFFDLASVDCSRHLGFIQIVCLRAYCAIPEYMTTRTKPTFSVLFDHAAAFLGSAYVEFALGCRCLCFNSFILELQRLIF